MLRQRIVITSTPSTHPVVVVTCFTLDFLEHVILQTTQSHSSGAGRTTAPKNAMSRLCLLLELKHTTCSQIWCIHGRTADGALRITKKRTHAYIYIYIYICPYIYIHIYIYVYVGVLSCFNIAWQPKHIAWVYNLSYNHNITQCIQQHKFTLTHLVLGNCK